ncbi:MAG: hypothetical protein HY248_05450 [Fimbriimonas ginsengisoli]|nr:hypothetical protein [Fimbriimonas ginsengisoli]
MYLVDVIEAEGLVEASLGGRVTAEEMKVFGQALATSLQTLVGQRRLFLDTSRAKELAREALAVLCEAKDRCLGLGDVKIVSLVRDSSDDVRQTTQRLQAVLEGSEQITSDPFLAGAADLDPATTAPVAA